MLQDITVALSDQLRAEALNSTGDIPSICVARSLEDGISPYEKCDGRKPFLEHLQPFGIIGCAQRGTRPHKPSPNGEQCVVLEIAHNHPNDTVKVLILETGQIGSRQTDAGLPFHSVASSNITGLSQCMEG